MEKHNLQLRVIFTAAIILGSAGYGLLISYDEDLARTIMLGYIGAVLTFFVLFECRRPPHD